MMVRAGLILGVLTLLAGCNRGDGDSEDRSRRVAPGAAVSGGSAATVEPGAVTLPPKRIATH